MRPASRGRASTSNGLSVTTRETTAATELLGWLPLPTEISCWLRDGQGLVAWGVAARFTAVGPSRFEQAQRWWDELVHRARVDDAVTDFGTGPVALASLGFGDADPAVLVVPQVLVGRRGGRTWITHVDGVAIPPRTRVVAPTRVTYHDGYVTDRCHQQAVAEAVERIRAGELDKVVLARDLIARAEPHFDQRHVVARLAERFPTCWVYAVDRLLGATPELLLSRRAQHVGMLVLAGTAWRQHPGEDPAQLEQRLLASTKDREEHQFAVRSALVGLAHHCSGVEQPGPPSVLHLPDLSHLATEITGRLTGAASLLSVCADLHPTAAVAGSPTAASLRVIRDLEPMPRSGYLGPVGWLDASGNGELGVALRCAYVQGSKARLFAGGGIVAQSTPDTEAAEVAAKFVAMRSALDR